LFFSKQLILSKKHFESQGKAVKLENMEMGQRLPAKLLKGMLCAAGLKRFF
jgi:hypothetical protein